MAKQVCMRFLATLLDSDPPLRARILGAPMGARVGPGPAGQDLALKAGVSARLSRLTWPSVFAEVLAARENLSTTAAGQSDPEGLLGACNPSTYTNPNLSTTAAGQPATPLARLV